MRLLTESTERRQCNWVVHSEDGYCDDWGAYLVDVTTWFFLGLPVWSRRVKVRDLAEHEVIRAATLGSYY